MQQRHNRAELDRLLSQLPEQFRTGLAKSQARGSAQFDDHAIQALRAIVEQTEAAKSSEQ
jgi:hypothetical protein